MENTEDGAVKAEFKKRFDTESVRLKQQEKVLAVPLLIILAGLWVGTPVFSEFRYAYPVFLTLPVILAATALSARTYGETIRPDAQGLTTSPAQKNMGM